MERPRIRVRLLPSACDAHAPLQYANTFVLNGTVAIDAGSLGFNGSPRTQSRVRHVVLTHCHADHIASLPMLLINNALPGVDPIEVWGSADTLDALRQHVFNDRIWPDLERIAPPGEPFVHFREFRPGEPFEVDGLVMTAVAVDHTVPTVGLLVEARGALDPEDPGHTAHTGHTTSLVIGGDSGPTDELWERAGELEGLRAVFLEASYPERELELAGLAKHLTPSLFAGEARKLPAGVPMYAVHLKPAHQEVICAELRALGLDDLHIVEPGREYTF